MTRWILDREPQDAAPSMAMRRTMPQLQPAGAARRVARGGDGGVPVDFDPTPAAEAAELATAMTVVAVAGAGGEAAAGSFLRGICRAEGQVVGSSGSASWFDGDSIRAVDPDAADAEGVAAMLAAMADRGCDSAILEVGPEAIDRRELDATPLVAVAVTGLGSGAEGRAARRRSYARLIRRVEAGGAVVIDADDHDADVLGAVNLRARRVTYGVDAAADAHPRANVSAVVARLDGGSCRFLLRGFDREVTVTLRVGGGMETVRQALAAAAVAWARGVAVEVVARGLESVARVPGRPEPARAGRPFEVRVDRAATADDLAQALADLRAIVAGRIICVVGAEGAGDDVPPDHRRDVARAALGCAAEAGADFVVLTVADLAGGDPNPGVDATLAGMARPGRARVELDRPTALAVALGEARAGDAVLVAGRVVPLDDVVDATLRGCPA